jgi:[acyl-carrier-protein] S-malonyltransferase
VTVAAWVDGEPVPAAEVLAEEARLRAGPAAALLPAEGTAAGRQLRRWVAQRVVLRRLLDHDGTARGLPPAAATPKPDPALLGTAAADVLATSPAARAVFAAVTVGVTVDEAAVREQHETHRDRYARPERWLVRQVLLPGGDGAPPASELSAALASARRVEVDPRTLLPQLRAAAPPPGRIAGPLRTRFGWHLLAVDAVLPAGPLPYAEVRDRIAAALLDRRRQAAFARWLDAEVAGRVRLATGFEHPADPGQPDATHRH